MNAYWVPGNLADVRSVPFLVQLTLKMLDVILKCLQNVKPHSSEHISIVRDGLHSEDNELRAENMPWSEYSLQRFFPQSAWGTHCDILCFIL